MKRRLIFRAFWFIFLSSLFLLFNSCVRFPYSLDKERVVEKTISAKKGGLISLKTAKGERFNLLIPKQALKKDTTLVATPLTQAPLKDQKGVFAKGVLLEEKGKGSEDKSTTFKFPVILEFKLEGPPPEGATIVKYLPKEKRYKVIPTVIATKGKKTTLTAVLTSLSGYGGVKVEKREIEKAQKEADWIAAIEVRKKVKKQLGMMMYSFTLNFVAITDNGNISGPYIGPANLTVEGELANPAPGGWGGKERDKLSGDVTINLLNVRGLRFAESGGHTLIGSGTLKLKGGGKLQVWTPQRKGEFSRSVGGELPFSSVTVSGSFYYGVVTISTELGTFKGIFYVAKLSESEIEWRKYDKERERWEREGRKGKPPSPPPLEPAIFEPPGTATRM